MRKLCLIAFMLVSQLPILAQDWSLERSPTPWWIQPQESISVILSGPQGKSGLLQLKSKDAMFQAALDEVSPGEYLATTKPLAAGSYSLELKTGASTQRLGLVEVASGIKTFSASEVTVTRQGPDPDFDRLTPLIPGAKVAVDASCGSWYRIASSKAWIDVDQKSITQAPFKQSRLQRIVVDSYPNGDAKLILSSRTIPQVEAVRQTDGSLSLNLFDCEQMVFDIKKHSKAANFLGAISVRPSTYRKAVIVTIEAGAGPIEGYQLAPGDKPGEFQLRIRTPLPQKLSELIVTLDPGHGGSQDTGTVGHLGLAEKELNLRVAKALAAQLKALGTTVIMTRTADTSVAPPEHSASKELQARIDASIEGKANLFLSLHHNARPDVEEGKLYHGTDVYWYQPQSEALARALVEPIAQAIDEPLRTSRYRSFHVIRQTFSPAVLIEFQYLSNPKLEAELLSSTSYPEQAAAGVVKGLIDYLATKNATK